MVDIEAFVESEPITVLFSAKGWIRALKGYKDEADLKDTKYKEGDKGRFTVKCKTTDKLLVFTTGGKFFTLGCDKIQTGKGFGEPIRLLVDVAQDEDVVDIGIYKPGEKLLVAAENGKGFIVPTDDIVAQTKSGKQVLNVPKSRAKAIALANGDHVAIVGTNRKMLVFPISELPEMKRGQGVQLQKYKEAKLSDIVTFNIEEGLTYKYGKGQKIETELTSWLGKRAQAGRMVPQGFAKNGKFS